MYLNEKELDDIPEDTESLTLTWDVFKYGNGKLQITNEDV